MNSLKRSSGTPTVVSVEQTGSDVEDSTVVVVVDGIVDGSVVDGGVVECVVGVVGPSVEAVCELVDHSTVELVVCSRPPGSSVVNKIIVVATIAPIIIAKNKAKARKTFNWQKFLSFLVFNISVAVFVELSLSFADAPAVKQQFH